MKTTMDISDNILLRAKQVARERNRTVKSLTEQGLLTVLDQLEAEKKASIKPVTFKGKGLSPEFADRGWSEIREAAYEGHGT